MAWRGLVSQLTKVINFAGAWNYRIEHDRQNVLTSNGCPSKISNTALYMENFSDPAVDDLMP